MSETSRGERGTDRSVVTAWVVLVVSLAGLVALFGWVSVHVVERPPGSSVAGPVPIDGVSDGIRTGVADDPSLVSRAEGGVADALPLAPARSGPEAVDSVFAAAADIDVETEVAVALDVDTETDEPDEPDEPDETDETGVSAKSAVSDADAVTDTASTDEGLEALRLLLAEAVDAKATSLIGPSEDGMPAASDAPRPVTATVLAELSSSVRFAYRGTTLGTDASNALDELAALLTARPGTGASVVVTGNEHRDEARDRVLARERGRKIIAELVDRGVDFEELSVDARRDEALAFGTHSVRFITDTDM